MKRTKAAVVLFAALLILDLCVTASADISIGISPPRITMGDAVRGGTYEETVTIFYSGDEPTTFTIVTEGECSDWLSLYDEDDLTTPLDELILDASDEPVANKIVLKVDVPKEMANAKYNGTVFLQSTPSTDKAKGGVAQPVVRMPLQVRIGVVGAQNLTGSAGNLTVNATGVGKPLETMVVFRNEGNVTAKPVINVTIMKDNTLVGSIEEAKTGIKPGCNGSISVLYNTTGMGPGDYLANVTVSLIDATIATVGNVTVGNVTLATEELPFTLSAAAAVGDE